MHDSDAPGHNPVRLRLQGTPRMPLPTRVAAVLLVLALPACTFVKMAPGAKQVLEALQKVIK